MRNLESILKEQGMQSPDFSEANFSLGIHYFNGGHFQEASESFHRAVRLSPGFLKARIGLAQSYQQIGQYKLAIREYREVLSLNPDNNEARGNLEALLELQSAR